MAKRNLPCLNGAKQLHKGVGSCLSFPLCYHCSFTTFCNGVIAIVHCEVRPACEHYSPLYTRPRAPSPTTQPIPFLAYTYWLWKLYRIFLKRLDKTPTFFQPDRRHHHHHHPVSSIGATDSLLSEPLKKGSGTVQDVEHRISNADII